MSERSRDALLAAAVVGVKLAAIGCVIALGFTHVSDDDYSRTVIAQAFAHSPRLDPSGTSWLPFPFWTTGALMMAFGRSLLTARAISWGFGALAASLPYLALRSLDVSRERAWVAAAACALAPWSVWLAATTVPEGWTGPAVGAALLFASSARRIAWFAAAALALAAGLSRYEAWPVCATLAVALLLRARTKSGPDGRALLIAAVISASAPLLWMAWNAHAHDGPLHFFARVSAFRQSSGVAPRTTAERALEYPLALLAHFPLALVGAVAALVPRDRRSSALPLLGAAAVLAFLIVGDLNDGAPTHHPERALGGVAVVCVCMGVARFRAPRRGVELASAGLLAVAVALQAFSARHDVPGSGEGESRRGQLARGRALTADPSAVFVVTPCQYEHFALIAATGTPERFVIEPTTRSPLTDECPRLRAP